MSLDPDEAMTATLGILGRYMDGDRAGAVQAWEAACPTPADGFVVLCGFALLIASQVPGGLGGGQLVVEVSRIDPTLATDDTLAMDVGAFVGAVGNGDYEGAWTVFDEACCGAGANRTHTDGAAFMAQLLKMAVATVEDARGR